MPLIRVPLRNNINVKYAIAFGKSSNEYILSIKYPPEKIKAFISKMTGFALGSIFSKKPQARQTRGSASWFFPADIYGFFVQFWSKKKFFFFRQKLYCSTVPREMRLREIKLNYNPRSGTVRGAKIKTKKKGNLRKGSLSIITEQKYNLPITICINLSVLNIIKLIENARIFYI